MGAGEDRGPHGVGRGNRSCRLKEPAIASSPADRGLLTARVTLAGRLDARLFALLRAIGATGSIHRAAAAVGLSHKGARLLLENAGNMAHAPLLASATGGAGGGGTRLTGTALALLAAWDRLQSDFEAFVRLQEQHLAADPALAGLLRRMSMQSTARNQFAGTITAIESGPVATQVAIGLKSGDTIVATMTTMAAKRMKLKKGQEALALVKASAVVLVTDYAGWQLSAANQLAGTLSRLERGAVSTLVVLTLPGGDTLTATVTNEGVDALAMEVGRPATAVFKASAVMVAVQG